MFKKLAIALLAVGLFVTASAQNFSASIGTDTYYYGAVVGVQYEFDIAENIDYTGTVGMTYAPFTKALELNAGFYDVVNDFVNVGVKMFVPVTNETGFVMFKAIDAGLYATIATTDTTFVEVGGRTFSPPNSAKEFALYVSMNIKF